MTNDDDLDTDLDVQEEEAAEPPAKPSLKEVWEGSPLLKIAAAVLGLVVLAGGYFIFFSGGEEEIKSRVGLAGSAEVKQIPGQKELDPAYKKALVESNIQTAKVAAQTGGSALPTPISTTKSGDIGLPGLPEKPKADPLAEWRAKAQGAVKSAGTSCPRTKEEAAQNLKGPGHIHCPGEVADGAGGETAISGADALLEEARRRAAANGTTVEEELRKMMAEKGGADPLLEEAKRRAAANGTTLEEELKKIAAEKAAAAALLEEAKRCAAANPGMTVEKCLEKIKEEKAAAAALLAEAKRCAEGNPGMTVEKCLEKIKAEKAALEEARRRAAANGTTVEEELAKLAATDPAAKALLEKAKSCVEANPGMTLEQCLKKIEAEQAALEEARRRAAANGTTVEEELAKMAAEKAAAEALLAEAKRCAEANPGMTVEKCLEKIKAEQALLEEAKRRAAANGTTVEEELAKIKAEQALLEEAKRRAAANGTTVEEELRKMAAEAAAASDEAKRKLADEAIRKLAGAAPPVAAPVAAPQGSPAPGAGGMPQMGAVAQTPEQAKEAAKALLDQMRVIVNAQTPPESKKIQVTQESSAYTKHKAELEKAAAPAGAAGTAAGATGKGATGDSAADEEEGEEPQVIVPAGSIAYAQLMTELNSDIMGPALVQILSGPFAGGRAIGKVKVKEAYNEYMVLTFNTIVKDGVSYKINAIAMDENTTLTGQATDIDYHYLERIILPAAAKFIEGYGGALAKTGSTVAPPTGAGAEPVTVAEPKPSPKESLFKGLEESTKVLSEVVGKGAERPVTVKIAKGTTMGLFFTESVTTGDAGK